MLEFSFQGSKTKSAAAATENRIQSIVSTNIDEMDSSLKADAELNQAPFDEASKKMKDGYSINPETTSLNQVVNKSYRVNEFTISSGISILMWVYIPDDPYSNFYNLSISFYNSRGEKLEWTFDYDTLHEMMGMNSKVGWKQFELVYDDATKNLIAGSSSSSGMTLNSMQINYTIDKNITELFPSTSTDTLSFYDVFTATSSVEESSIIRNLRYYYYEFSEGINNALRMVYKDDSYTLPSLSETFSYIIVGKNNIAGGGAVSSKFTWQVSLKIGNAAAYDINFRDVIVFDQTQTYIISFKLTEQRGEDNRTVFTATKSVDVLEYSFGGFEQSSYKIEKKDTYVLKFKLSDDFSLTSSVSFASKDEKIAKIEKFEYSEELNVYYVFARGVKKGQTEIVATASGIKSGEIEETEFSEAVSISVTSNGINDGMLITLYVILGCFGAAFVIFLIISLVNARRNIVK